MIPKFDREGFWWATWIKADPGTRDQDGDFVGSGEIEPVQVICNCVDPDNNEPWRVLILGVEKSQSVENFEWGAPIDPRNEPKHLAGSAIFSPAKSATSAGPEPMADHTDSLGYPLAEQPHPDAYFDPAWRSRYGPKPMDGWRLAIRCTAGCEDGVSSMAATHTLTPDDRCPICAGPIEMFNRDAEVSR